MRILAFISAAAAVSISSATYAQPLFNTDVQTQFHGCLTGYIGAKYMGRPLTTREEDWKLAEQIVREIAVICPNPDSNTPNDASVFTDPSPANSWMVGWAYTYLVSFSKGEKPLPISSQDVP